MEELRTFLTDTHTYIPLLFRLAEAPPQVVVIEGGTTHERFLTSFAYSLLLSCTNSFRPCYICDACTTLSPYANASQEYTLLEKKQKQEHGTYVIIGDTAYLNGSEGVYSKQIVALKKYVTDKPKFRKHVVIIEDFHAIHSIKEVTNALLKTMEESSHCSFILTVPERNTLIQTILSRAFILTLPFTTSRSLSIQNTWVDAFITFLIEGKGWFTKSMSKEECLPHDIEALVLTCITALCEYHSGTLESPLAQLFGKYKPSLTLCTHIIQEAEQALHAHINPLLIADTLAIRLYTLLHSTQQ